MLDQRSPIVSQGGCLGALRADLTKELRTAIATAQTDESHIGIAGIGVPLIDKEMTAATAHVLPLAHGISHATHPGVCRPPQCLLRQQQHRHPSISAPSLEFTD